MKTITEAEYLNHTNNYDGYCTACGEFTCGGVEPDAEGYPCPFCDEPAVCGTEDALLTRAIDIE